MSEVCNGSSPWQCSAIEARSAFELASMGLLPVGTDVSVNIVSLLNALKAEKITAEEIRAQYRVNGLLNQSY